MAQPHSGSSRRTGTYQHCETCNAEFYVPRWQSRRSKVRFCSSKCYGATLTNMTQRLGDYTTPGAHAGDKHWNWRGGVSDLNERIRRSYAYKEWRKAVFKRDDYTCQACGQYGRQLVADHIVPFAIAEDKRFDLDNGRTLCRYCHSLTDTYGVNFHRWNLVEQYREGRVS